MYIFGVVIISIVASLIFSAVANLSVLTTVFTVLLFIGASIIYYCRIEDDEIEDVIEYNFIHNFYYFPPESIREFIWDITELFGAALFLIVPPTVVIVIVSVILVKNDTSAVAVLVFIACIIITCLLACILKYYDYKKRERQLRKDIDARRKQKEEKYAIYRKFEQSEKELDALKDKLNKSLIVSNMVMLLDCCGESTYDINKNLKPYYDELNNIKSEIQNKEYEVSNLKVEHERKNKL